VLVGGHLNLNKFISGWEAINNNMGFKPLLDLNEFDSNKTGVKNYKIRFNAVADIEVYVIFILKLINSSVGLTGTDPIDGTELYPDSGTSGYTVITDLSNYTDVISAYETLTDKGQILIKKIEYNKANYDKGVNGWLLDLNIDYDKLNNITDEYSYNATTSLYTNALILVNDKSYNYKYEYSPIKKYNNAKYTDVDNIINYLNILPVYYDFLQPVASNIIIPSNALYINYAIRNNYIKLLAPQSEDEHLDYIEATAIESCINIPDRKGMNRSLTFHEDNDKTRVISNFISKRVRQFSYDLFSFSKSPYFYNEKIIFNASEKNSSLDTDLANDLQVHIW